MGFKPFSFYYLIKSGTKRNLFTGFFYLRLCSVHVIAAGSALNNTVFFGGKNLILKHGRDLQYVGDKTGKFFTSVKNTQAVCNMQPSVCDCLYAGYWTHLFSPVKLKRHHKTEIRLRVSCLHFQPSY